MEYGPPAKCRQPSKTSRSWNGFFRVIFRCGSARTTRCMSGKHLTQAETCKSPRPYPISAVFKSHNSSGLTNPLQPLACLAQGFGAFRKMKTYQVIHRLAEKTGPRHTRHADFSDQPLRGLGIRGES